MPDMNRLALGTVQFGLPYGIANVDGQVAGVEAKAMLDLAASAGVDILDTAIAYGESEARLGELGTKKFKIVTKLPSMPADCRDIKGWVGDQLAGSFRRLGVDAIYAVLLHRSEDLLRPSGEALYAALQELKDSRRIMKIGLSIYSPSELDALIPRFRFELVQAPFNLLDRRLLNTGWLERLKDQEVEVHTRSCFLQGLLLMVQEKRPKQFAPWADLWARWHDWLAHHETTALEACLAFSLSQQMVDRVVVGADSVSQLKQILAATAKPISGDAPDLASDEPALINPSLWGIS